MINSSNCQISNLKFYFLFEILISQCKKSKRSFHKETKLVKSFSLIKVVSFTISGNSLVSPSILYFLKPYYIADSYSVWNHLLLQDLFHKYVTKPSIHNPTSVHLVCFLTEELSIWLYQMLFCYFQFISLTYQEFLI